jgi:preprotein translocase subunit SecB
MALQLQLEDYALTRLNVAWRPPTKKKVSINSLRYDFDYDVGVHSDDDKRYKLDLRIRLSELGKEEAEVGYSIEADITGFFAFVPECDEPTREKLIRVNGFAMLYSTFRGLLGGITGTFPGGKLNLPAVMPQEIVQQIEDRRRGKASAAAPAAKTAKS